MASTSSINTSGISIGSDGKISISGVSSGIDSKALIDAAVTAKRAPAIKLEAKIVANNQLITAYSELKTLVAALTTALEQLRGSNSFGSDNVFKTKAVSGSAVASETAPTGHVASDIGSLLTVSVEDAAQVADHKITIHQLAKAHQVRSDSFNSTTTALTSLGVTAGDITINGESITIDADDTLLDLRSKINSAGAGVTATIVSADSSTNYLVLTSSETGAANAISFGTGSTTSDTVGLTTGTPDPGTAKNLLQEAMDAIIDVDGIADITRSSNNIDDVIEGVTLSLLKAEANTEISLKIEPDLTSIKTAVSDLVTAYNDIRDFYTEQRTASDRNEDGTVDDDEVGPLARDNTLRSIISKLGDISGFSMDDNADGYQSLSQLGVVVNEEYKLELDESVFDSKLLTDVDSFRKLFAFEFSSDNSAMSYLGRADSTQSGTYYVNIAGTDADGNLISGNIQTVLGTGSGGADDGSLTVSGKQATAGSSSEADGLLLYFNPGASSGAVNDIQVTFSRGVADSFYNYFEQLTQTSGGLDTRISELTETNTNYQEDIEVIDTRLETTRRTLEAKYTAMEVALANLESLKNTITTYFDTSSSDS